MAVKHAPLTRTPPDGRVRHRSADPNAESAAWAALCARLIDEFRHLGHATVIAEVVRARAATELFGLSVADRVHSTEAIARNNLAIACGGADLARLDPERHTRRKHETG